MLKRLNSKLPFSGFVILSNVFFVTLLILVTFHYFWDGLLAYADDLDSYNANRYKQLYEKIKLIFSTIDNQAVAGVAIEQAMVECGDPGRVVYAVKERKLLVDDTYMWEKVLISASEKLETKTVLYELKSRHPVAF
jgi:hypothetical protein